MALIIWSVKTCALGPLCPLSPRAPAEAGRSVWAAAWAPVHQIQGRVFTVSWLVSIKVNVIAISDLWLFIYAGRVSTISWLVLIQVNVFAASDLWLFIYASNCFLQSPPHFPPFIKRTTTTKEQLWSWSSSVFSPYMLRHQGLPKSAAPGHSSSPAMHHSSSPYCPTSTFWRIHTGIYSLLQKHTKNYSLPQRTFSRFCNEFNSREIWRQWLSPVHVVSTFNCALLTWILRASALAALPPLLTLCVRMFGYGFISQPPPPPTPHQIYSTHLLSTALQTHSYACTQAPPHVCMKTSMHTVYTQTMTEQKQCIPSAPTWFWAFPQRGPHKAAVAHHHLILIVVAVVEEVRVSGGLAQNAAVVTCFDGAQVAGVVGLVPAAGGAADDGGGGGAAAQRLPNQNLFHL